MAFAALGTAFTTYVLPAAASYGVNKMLGGSSSGGGGGGGGGGAPAYIDPELVRSGMMQGTETQQRNLGNLYGKYDTLGEQMGVMGRGAYGAGMDMLGQGGDVFGRAGGVLDKGMGAMDKGFGFLDQAGGLLEGTSPILTAMRQQQAESLGDVGAQQGMQQNRMLASRGMGMGGMKQALGRDRTSQLGEQARKGLLGIQQYGLQAGQGFGQLGANVLGQGANIAGVGSGLYGQAANMYGKGLQGMGLGATFGAQQRGAIGGAQGVTNNMLDLITGANAAATQQMAANAGYSYDASQQSAANRQQSADYWGQQAGNLVSGVVEGWNQPQDIMSYPSANSSGGA